MDEFKAGSLNENKYLSILHYNIHSIQKHIDSLSQSLESLDFKFDILCLSESKLQKSKSPIVNE